MKAILNLFLQICLLRQSPAHVPTQGWFVALVVLANLASSVIISRTIDPTVNLLQAATAIVVMQTVVAALTYLTLALNNRPGRFPTAITALFGCDLIITACQGLIMPLAFSWGEAAANVSMAMFLVWTVAVFGFILHRAMEAPLAVGIGVAMAIVLVSGTFGQIAIGTPGST